MSRSDKYIRKAISTLYVGDKTKCPISPRAPYSVWRTYGARRTGEKYPFVRPEILAPATVSTYKTAISSGADAIYFGYGTLNARAGAENFSDLHEVVDYCHLHGVKAYLTLNVMIKDSEICEAKKIILEAEKAKIDAFIISDLSLVNLIRRNSSAAIHASTQMGIHNAAGAKFLQKLGFSRVVLSREITKKELVDILDNTDLEVEIFVHGALCVSFSGACLFSAMLTGKSGNRGRCTQLCRRQYSCLIDDQPVGSGYLLSPKDLCLASLYKEFVDLNVDSLKIEGRLKGPEYVGAVTKAYSDLHTGVPFSKETEDNLKICFNRGNFTRGYFDNKDVIYPYFANHIGLRCGRVSKVLSKNLVAVRSTKELFAGDFLKVTRGMEEIGGLEVTGEKKTVDGETCYVCHNPQYSIAKGDVIAVTKRKFPESDGKKKLIEIAVRLVGGEEIHLIATFSGIVFDYYGQTVDLAKTAPISEEDVMKAFARTGDADFDFIISTIVVKDAFLPKKALNALRRTVVEYFSEKMISDYRRQERKKASVLKSCEKVHGDFAEFDSLESIPESVKETIKNIVFSPKEISKESAEAFYKAVKTDGNMVWYKPPVFIPADKQKFVGELIKSFDGAVAQNYCVIQMCIEEDVPYVVGWAMNIANCKNPLLKSAAATVLSVEMKSSEIKRLNDSVAGAPPLVYG
ncbi:MAG: U32 family peptidase, partial [Clostridia bacterium]|nr:U32 family peptidase [Clostridia bacterium]